MNYEGKSVTPNKRQVGNRQIRGGTEHTRTQT